MKKLIFFCLISFLFGAIWFTPLAFVVPHLAKITSDVVLQEPSGTIWDGEVNHLTVQNNYLGKATWRVDPLQSLKSLSLKTKFTLKGNDLNAYGVAGLTINKNLIIDNTQFDVNASYLNTLQTNAKLSGTFNGFVKHATIKKNTVPAIDAIVNWQDGALIAPFKLAEGDYRAEIKPKDENLDIKLKVYDRLLPFLNETAILTTNTSGLTLKELSQNFSKELKSRFMVSHFFNPPRYMHLLELVKGDETSLQTYNTVSDFGKNILRR